MINIIGLIKAKFNILTITENSLGMSKYFIIPAYPARGILFVTHDNPGFISGHVRLRGKDQGRYPYNYLEMIDNIFGKEENTIEVCSHSVRGRNWSHRTKTSSCYTVDINPETRPDLVDDGQELRLVSNNRIESWQEI